MANKENILASWSHRKDGHPKLKILLHDPNKNEKVDFSKFQYLLDTGFTGSILVPPSLYESLELPRYEIKPIFYKTADGSEIEVNRAIGLVNIPKMDFEEHVIIETSEKKKSNREIMIGCMFIKFFEILLSGESEETSIIEVSSQYGISEMLNYF